MTLIRLFAAALTLLAFAMGASAEAEAPALADISALTQPVAPVTQGADSTGATAPARIVPAPKKPWLVFTLRGGVDIAPAYFGSADSVVWHDWHIGVEYLRFGSHRIFGHPHDTFAEKYGFSIAPDFRLINGRDPAKYPEINGTYLIFPSLEVGLGVSWTQRKYEIRADARYGLFGHESWSGEISGNYHMYPDKKLRLWIGPRFGFGTNSYADRWYGIDSYESTLSGLPIHDPAPGLLRVGVEFGANYDLHEVWDFEAAFKYDRLVNGAASSPVTLMGSEEQLSGRIGLVRRFTWR